LIAASDACRDDGHGTAQGELDELEREEFFRLKKVQNKKKRDDGARAKAATDKVTLCIQTLPLPPLPQDISTSFHVHISSVQPPYQQRSKMTLSRYNLGL